MRYRHFLFLCIAIGLFATSCNTNGPATSGADATGTPAEMSVTLEATAATGPTRVLFVSNDQEDVTQVDLLATEFETLAGESGYGFERQNELIPENLDGTVRAVILVGSFEGAGEQISQHPEIGFIVVGGDASLSGGNVYLLSNVQGSRDQVAFLAGYMAAVATFDWRVGAVVSNDPTGTADLEAFIAGARFFCGWCRPVYPPYYEYPQTITASSADEAGGLTAAGSLSEMGVETVYVPIELAVPEFLGALAESGVAIITPAEPVNGIENQWMATIQMASSEGLGALWEAMLAGEPAPAQSWSLTISNLNSDLISDGRATLVRQLAEELQSGFVDTGITGVE